MNKITSQKMLFKKKLSGWMNNTFHYISNTLSITHVNMTRQKNTNAEQQNSCEGIILNTVWHPEHHTFSQSSCSISTRILMSSGIARAGWVSFSWIATWESGFETVILRKSKNLCRFYICDWNFSQLMYCMSYNLFRESLKRGAHGIPAAKLWRFKASDDVLQSSSHHKVLLL